MKFGFLFFMFNVLTNISAQIIDSAVIKQVDSLIIVSRELTDQGDFEQAFVVNADAEKLAFENLGHESAAYGSCAFNRGNVNDIKKDYPEAEKWYLKAKNIREKVLGKEHPDYVASIDYLSILYFKMGNYEKAEPLIIEVKTLRNKILGSEHSDNIKSFKNLAILYSKTGNYKKSEPLLLELKIMIEKEFGKDHQEYANVVSTLATLYSNSGNYEKAEVLFMEAKEILGKVLGKEHLDYARCVNNFAGLYNYLNNYEKAMELMLEAKAIKENIFGKEHPDYANSLNALAILNMNMGNYELAEPLCLEANAVQEKILGKNDPYYANGLNTLATLYYKQGSYDRAEPLFIKVVAIMEKVLGTQHPEFALTLNNLGSLYVTIGNYDKAEKLLIEAMQIREISMGNDNAEYAKSLSNLALLYNVMGDYDKAILLYQQASSIQEKILGKESHNYGQSLNNLGQVYMHMRNFQKAEYHYIEARSIREKTLGKDHPDYASNLNNLANLYSNMGKYDKAEPLYSEAQAIQEKVLGKEHPDYSESLNNQALLLERQNRFSESEPILKEAYTHSQARLVKATSFLSEQELAKYKTTFQSNLDHLSSYLFARQTSNVQLGILPQLAYDHVLFHKGFLLTSTTRLNSPVTESPETAIINLRLKGYRRRLAGEYAKPIVERKGLVELEEKANYAEKELARSVTGYADALRQVRWQEIQAAMPKDAVALEFVQFQVNFPNKTDSVQYAVLLLRPGLEQPHFIPLFEEQRMIQLLEARQQHKRDYVNNIYAWAERDTLQQMESGRTLTKLGAQKQSLYELIWEKIEATGLKDVKTIYYAPSGILHRINIGAIAIEETQRLSDRYQLVALNSTRQIVTGKVNEPFTSGADALVYGGIQFEADTTEIIQMVESDFPLVVTRSLAAVIEDSTLRGGSWQYLHWTQKEAETISTTLSKGGLNAEHLSGMHATEESFKAMGQSNNPSPQVLHIATHGFFFPDPKQQTSTSLEDQSVFKWSDNPMIRSGIILAGGNYAWQHGRAVSPDKEDGILTAYEISQMNLSNTELVVLSACETGLGDIQGNEGVYGLQRAFKIAGAKYLIMSLWQVPDRETMEFMTTFYKNWLDGKMTIPDAFRKSQREMRDRFYNPYSWAGFVLVE